MELNFAIILENEKEMKVYDITKVIPSLPLEIYSMTLDILSASIPNGRIPFKLDVLNYLKGSRTSKEIYTITSNVLGLGMDQIIPDGIYHIEYIINTVNIKNNTFLVYQTVENKIKELLEEVNYSIEVGEYDVTYVGEYSTYDIEKVRMAVALLDELKSQTQTPNEVKVNDTLDKLERLLLIIREELNI